MRSPRLPLPDRERLSAMLALVLLAYCLLRVVELPAYQGQIALFGLIFRLTIDTHFVMLSMAGALAAIGARWLLRSHPRAEVNPAGWEHQVLPGLAAIGIGALLARLPIGIPFLLGLVVSGILLLMIFLAEFVVFDPSDRRYPWAAIGLRTLSTLLMVGLAFTTRAFGLRAAFSVPILLVAFAGLCWRVLDLESGADLRGVYALGIGWAAAQLAWAMHYWPISPIRSALLLGTVAYIGTELVLALAGDGLRRRKLIELGLLTGAGLTIAFLFG